MLYNPPMTFPRLKCFVDQAKFKVSIWRILRSGPPYPSRLDRIIIDLTHCCDLSCLDCNRSCGVDQAPAEEFISLDQIRRFVTESIAAGKHWRRIMLEGGEPTLHPQLDEIHIAGCILLYEKHRKAPQVKKLAKFIKSALAMRLFTEFAFSPLNFRARKKEIGNLFGLLATTKKEGCQ